MNSRMHLRVHNSCALSLRILPSCFLLVFLFAGMLQKVYAGSETSFTSLKTQLDSVIRSHNCRVGFGLRLEGGAQLILGGGDKCPMMSVVKFPLAMLVLKGVDEGRLHLSDSITVMEQQWMHFTWTPLGKRYGYKSCRLSIDTLLWAMISESDNNACDILFDLVGGPKKLQAYVDSLGFRGFRVRVNERMLSKPVQQYSNWCTVQCMLDLLQRFNRNTILSPSSTKVLMRMMTESRSPSNRIKDALPAAATLAHKTGTGDLYKGKLAAFNDVGIVTLPNGTVYYLTIFVHDADMDEDACAALIRELTKRSAEALNN